MRGGKSVPMIALCLLLCGCGAGKESAAEQALRPYRDMSGCEMESEVLCGVGSEGGKILSTLWLRQEDGTPLRGEIAVDDEIILQAEFTAFQFHDKID